MSVFQAIKSYDPSKYDPEKDETGAKSYLDGFRYISAIAKRLVKRFHAYHHRDKRIPPEMICSLEPDFYVQHDFEKPSEVSTLDMMVEGILNTFDDTYHKGVSIKKVMTLLFSGLSHKEIAKELKAKKKIVEEIINKVTSKCELESGQTYFSFYEDCKTENSSKKG